MNRKETTQFLTDILVNDRLSDRKYYAKEVTLDMGTDHTKRIDVVQFIPQGTIHASDMEKGTFICYEIKSCIQDVYSGNGLNFYGEKNYIVTTMDTYKKLQEDFRSYKFWKYMDENHPESSRYLGVMVPVPKCLCLQNTNQMYAEYEHPTKLSGEASDWQLWTALPCHEGRRDRSIVEMLFCMLRSKHSDTNRGN